MNVLEDARIERMMKVTYPGLRQTFFEGYKELWDQDFFGVKEELPYIPFIDRINLYFKGNPGFHFPMKSWYGSIVQRKQRLFKMLLILL